MAMGMLGGLLGMGNDFCVRCNSHYCHHTIQSMAAQQQQGMQHYHDAMRHYGAIGSRISVNNKDIVIGNFKTKEDAYEAYKKAYIKYHGAFSCVE